MTYDFIAFEGTRQMDNQMGKTTIPANEQELASRKTEISVCLQVSFCSISENSIGDTSNLFKMIYDTPIVSVYLHKLKIEISNEVYNDSKRIVRE